MYINDIVRKRKKNNRKEEVDEGETNSVMLVPYIYIFFSLKISVMIVPWCGERMPQFLLPMNLKWHSLHEKRKHSKGQFQKHK